MSSRADITTIARATLGSRLVELPDRAAWLAYRATDHRIGGSDVAAILGVSPWGGPWDVWARKVEGIEPVRSADDQAMLDRGTRLEVAVLGEYTALTGRAVWQPGQALIHHADHPWAIGSPDGLTLDAGELGGVEAKTATRADGWGAETEILEYDEAVVPPQYALQCYWYLACSGLPWWDLTVLLPRLESRTYRIHRDAELQEDLVSRISEWRDRHLIGGEPPDLDASDAARQWMSRRWPGDPAKTTVEATPEIQALAMEAGRLSVESKASQAAYDLAKARLAAAMGDAYKASCSAGSVIYTLPGERKTLDGKALAAAHPDFCRAYERTSPTARSIRLYGGWSK